MTKPAVQKMRSLNTEKSRGHRAKNQTKQRKQIRKAMTYAVGKAANYCG